MTEFLGIFCLGIGLGLIAYGNPDKWWTSIIGFLFFSVGLDMIIKNQIKKVKKEILAELEDR